MVDLQTVCCMCGDVGFPDKLFRCNKCRNRIQHSEFAEPIEMCDWCQSEERSSRHGNSSKKSFPVYETGITNRSEYSGDKIKQQDREETTEKGKNPSGAPSPRPTTRRYKLLKDVMC
ncbi:Zinc ion-binding protein [Melia azedarach]|uniref:Zinc ion-binding protein n=1 Tax=Melia azedarach TaxID=155640 RepID=A0ACC1YVZ0_MELAZ|nr:Zinc ion-binding protein [Melia azedarach]